MIYVIIMEYTNREYVAMHFIYGMRHGNGTAAAEEYRRHIRIADI